jgi:hypothetical protein
MNRLFKKLGLSLCLVFLCAGTAFATQKYPLNAVGNWSAAGTWTLNSDCTVNATTVPGTADAVTFPACAQSTITCDSATCSSNTLIFQSANNKLTIGAGNDLQVAGSLTLFAGMTLTAGSATSTITHYMISGGSISLTPAGVNWGGVYRMYDNSTTALTVALGASWQVNTFKIQNANTGLLTLNGNTLTVVDGTTLLIPNGDGSGTTILSIAGNGHLQTSDSASTHRFDYPVTFTSGTPVIDTGFEIGGSTARDLTYAGGTPSMASAAELVLGGGVNWKITYAQVPIANIRMQNNGTVTLSNSFTSTGYYTGAGSLTLSGAYSWLFQSIISAGSITASNVNTKMGTTGGTSGVHSTWSRTGTAVHQVSFDVGDYTDISDTVSWGNTGDVLRILGSHCTHTGTFTIFPSSATLDTALLTWANLNVGGSSGLTATMSSDLNVSGNIVQANNVNVSWTGAYDWHCANYLAAQAQATGNNLTISAGRTLYVSTGMQIFGAFGTTPNRFTIKSGTGGVKANLAYSGSAASLILAGIATTDIAASPAIKIYNAGTIATSTGVSSFTNASFQDLYGVIQ